MGIQINGTTDTISAVDGSLDINQNATFGNNVTIGGTLTYSDVTNIDSVGLVTAKNGLRIHAGGIDLTSGISTFSDNIQIADKIIHKDDTNTAIRFPDADTFAVETAGSERVRVSSAGRVGINTTTPTDLLTIVHSANTDDGISIVNTNNSQASAIAQLELSAGDNSHARVQFECNGKYSTIRHDGNGHLWFNTNGSNERLRITSDGNTKFWGTRSGALQPEDDDNLQIYTKSADNSINRGSGITFYNHDNSGYEMGGTIQVAKENGTVDDTAGYMRFSTRPAGAAAQERLRITSVGRVGINQESPDARLHISGTNDAIIRLESTDTGLGQDELVGAVEFEKNDASGAGAGVCGGVRCYSEDSYGARTYLAFAVRSNSTGQAATDTEICRITRHGLIFDTSVTGSDSAKALDSYEEGQYIPTVVAHTSGSWTTTSYRYLAYVKIGKLVHIQGYLNINSESSPSGSVRISLPFSVDSTLSENAEYGNISVSMRGHGGSNLYNLNGAVSSNYIELVAVNGAGSHNWIGEDDIGSSWNIRIGGCFIAA